VSLKDEKGIQVLNFQTVGKEFLFMNPGLKPFTDKRVRQAVNYAINKQNIIDNVFMGLAIPLSSALPKGMQFHVDKPMYDYNPEKAKQLLAEAGFPNGFSVELAHRIGYSVHEEAAVYVQADLAKVGIKADIIKLAPATFTERMRKNQLPFGFSHFIPYVNHPAYHVYWQYHGESGYNYPRYNNPRVNELIDKVQIELDIDKQKQYFEELQDIVYEDCPEVILVQYFFSVVMRDNLKGYVFYPDRISRWDLMTKE
jgi:peptide/nickel transport system substrate-binding protein